MENLHLYPHKIPELLFQCLQWLHIDEWVITNIIITWELNLYTHTLQNFSKSWSDYFSISRVSELNVSWGGVTWYSSNALHLVPSKVLDDWIASFIEFNQTLSDEMKRWQRGHKRENERSSGRKKNDGNYI